MNQIVNKIAECPQCGAATSPSDRNCSYCKAEFFVTSLAYLGGVDSDGVAKYLKHFQDMILRDPQNVEGLMGLGLCYLQMGTYPFALKQFEQIIEFSPELPQAYYYFALASINGRRIMTLSLNEVRRIETILNTAIQMDGHITQFKLLLAMLKRDYYETNGLKVPPPDAEALLSDINGHQINKNELDRLKKAVRVDDQDTYFCDLTVI